MHGFNQGENLLIDVCKANLYNVIFVQEHWLNDSNINKFLRFNNYDFFGISGMGEATRNNILLGRPYGGVLTMITKSLSTQSTLLLCKERLVIIKVIDYIYINAYLPCKDNSVNTRDILLEILSDISTTIDENNYAGLIFGADYNCNLCSNSDQSCIIKDFLSQYDMKYIDIMKFNSSDIHTFSNGSGGTSVIDYICVSTNLLRYVSKYDVVHSAFNFSDHEPVEITLTIPDTDLSNVHALCSDDSVHVDNYNLLERVNVVDHGDSTSMFVPCEQRFRFDHCNPRNYYDCTYQLLNPLYMELCQLYSNLDYGKCLNELCSHLDIERWYSTLTDALLLSSYRTVPCTKSDVYRHWWNESLDLLKQNCINSHNLWLDGGKPRSGPIFLKRNADRNAYRSMIHQNRTKSKQGLSDTLLHSLYSGKLTKFWKTWKTKVCENKQIIPNIEGTYSELEAVKSLKVYFEKLCNSIDEKFDENISKRLQEKLTLLKSVTYHGPNRLQFNPTLIELCVSKLHSGKSPGFDMLQKEHLKNAHPILYDIIAKLFYIILFTGYVPKDFGSGIVIPIQKDSSCKGVQKLDNFRGITLCCVISKVFEHSILFLYGPYLKTDDRQFGFKKNLGCVHAIHCVKSVINFFVSNDSTVSMCCLDISKAFDRLNHNCLFFKLVQLNVPLYLINVLVNWYSKLAARIRWGSCLSGEYRITCGIRQGGVLSPILFSVYINNVIKKLSKLGCYMKGISCSSFMYADDLILLAPSVSQLQTMINLCCMELKEIDLNLNLKKSCCIRIGKKHSVPCSDITTSHGIIPWVKRVKYLGLLVLGGNTLKFSFDESKCKFYSSFNAFYSKLGSIADPNVTLHLLESISIPTLLYAVEALNLTKSELNNLDHTLDRTLCKIFKVSRVDTLNACKHAYGILSISERYAIMKRTFQNKLLQCSNLIVQLIGE